MKKQIVLLTAIFFAVSMVMVGCKAEVHSHTYSEAWTNDASGHWHVATCEHKDEVINFEEHSFGDWITTKEPTEEAEGSQERVCDVCKYKETAEIAKLEHKHVAGESWKNDDKNHWKECTGCKEQLESAEHEYEWIVTKEATCTEEGSKTGTCKVCKKEVTEKIPAKGHSYSETWTSDAEKHWHASTCGHEVTEGKTAHTFGDWTTTKEATCTEEGSKTGVCEVCKKEVTEKIPAKGHNYSETWTTTKVATKEEAGSKERVCTVCNCKELVDVAKVPEDFVLVNGTTITGNESWTPSSSVFKSGRKLTIPNLYVSDHEVTRGEYTEVMGSDPSTASAYDKNGTKLTGDAVLNNPVNNVNWYDALVYCNKLSIMGNLTPCYSINGSTNPEDWGTVPTSSDSIWNTATCYFEADGYRLPTEAEWEWLARGGKNYKYAGSDNVDDVAWYTSNTNGTGTREVKTKAQNGYGLYDMSGNVYEWCWDWYDSISDSTASDGAASGSKRVQRGGSWCRSDYGCRVAGRNFGSPNLRYIDYGFRVVRPSSN